MKKKILSALLAAAMVVSSCLPVFAEGEVQPQPIPETPAIVNEAAEEFCECGLAKGHEGECQEAKETPEALVQPEVPECSCGAAEGEVHKEDCLLYVNSEEPEIVVCEECKQTEGHLDTCSQYAAPVTKCEHCGIELTEGAVHLDSCLSFCTCEPIEGVHQEGCKFYEASVEEVVENTPQVGDKIWIKHNSYVYKNQATENGHKLLLNYEVEIVNIFTDENGVAVWYEFEPNGALAILYKDYKYVQVENTSEEEPEPSEAVDEFACNCDENAPENIADHADSCPRKAYIKTLFDGKSAEEIYAQWETYDEATQTDLLNMLQRWDNTKYVELKELIDNKEGNDFPVVKVEGVSVGIIAEEGVFLDGTSVQISNVENASSQIEASTATLSEHLSDYTVKVLSSKVIDISFVCDSKEVQPDGRVFVTFDIPVVPSANHLAIFHIADDDSAELMAVQNLENTAAVTVTVEATHFSHYVILQSETTYNPTLLRKMLSGNQRYSIVEFPVTLNDFDASAYNNAYGSSGLCFTTGTAGTGMNLGALPATQGIVKNELSSKGYPITHGEDRGSIIFSADDAEGKIVHSNVEFEFIYDNETGYYTYNSGANHAQYDSSTNKVELYADTLAPFNYRTDWLTKMTTNPNRKYVKKMAMSPNDGTNIIAYVEQQTDEYMFEITDAHFPDVDTNDYTHMYLRLKATFGGDIKCKVFYSDGSDDTYTLSVQDDTWADYVFGPFDTGKTAKSVLFYVPSAVKGDSVEIDTAGVLQTKNALQINYAGFYPFTTLTTSYAGSEKFNINTWESLIQSGNNHQLYSSRVMYNKQYDSDEPNTLADPYAYFAMAMEVEFYIPANGQVNGQDIVFNFNGDDDMWVFVDNKLALDIGGAHTDVEGSINFTTGATYVANVRSLTDSTTTGNGPKNGNLSSGQYATGEYHKLKIFYMERAGTNSNCMIKFNLPVVPTSDVIVSKQVVEQNGCSVTESGLDDLEFTFTAKVNGKEHAEADYTIVTIDESGEMTRSTGQTDESGQFKLKHNQKAYFSDLKEGSEVKITESKPNNASYSYIGTTVKNNNCMNNGMSALGTTSADGKLVFDFINTFVAKADLTIIKEGLDTTKDKNQSTVYTINGPKDFKLDVVIYGNDSVTIKDLPIGSYTVTEKTDWSWRYEVGSIDKDATADNKTITIALSYQGETVTYTNKREKIYWLSGDSYCENWWGGENGIVTKRKASN